MANSNFGRDENKNNVNLDEWVKQYLGESQTDITELREKVNNLWDTFYPVGSLYFTVVNNNPGAFLGGTWVLWGSGRVPVCINQSVTAFDTTEKVGGSIDHTHNLATGWAKIGLQGPSNQIVSRSTQAQSSYSPDKYVNVTVATPSGSVYDATELGGNTTAPSSISMPYILAFLKIYFNFNKSNPKPQLYFKTFKSLSSGL